MSLQIASAAESNDIHALSDSLRCRLKKCFTFPTPRVKYFFGGRINRDIMWTPREARNRTGFRHFYLFQTIRVLSRMNCSDCGWLRNDFPQRRFYNPSGGESWQCSAISRNKSAACLVLDFLSRRGALSAINYLLSTSLLSTFEYFDDTSIKHLLLRKSSTEVYRENVWAWSGNERGESFASLLWGFRREVLQKNHAADEWSVRRFFFCCKWLDANQFEADIQIRLSADNFFGSFSLRSVWKSSVTFVTRVIGACDRSWMRKVLCWQACWLQYLGGKGKLPDRDKVQKGLGGFVNIRLAVIDASNTLQTGENACNFFVVRFIVW
jgi:hypothetical protein